MSSSRRAEKVSAAEAVERITSGRRVVLPLCCGLPRTLIEALVDQADRLQSVEIVSGLQIEYPWLADGLEQSFTFRTWQCAPPIRKLIPSGRVKYIPMRQGDAVRVFGRGGPWPVDVALIQVSPFDADGFASLGVSIGHCLPLARQAGLVIAEVNPRMPRVLGRGMIHRSEIDLIVESDRELLEFSTGGAPGDKETEIGRLAAELIPDGATIQIGLGGIPDAIMDALGEKKNLRFFAMGIDKMVDLVEAGAVASGEGPGIVVTETLGTRRIFDFIDDNPLVEGRPLPEVIDSRAAGAHDRFCSVLSALEIDLTGQVNSETIRGDQFSAVGGSFDFLQGALFSPGGVSVIALTATTPNGKISRIVPRLAEGAAVTIPRHSVDYVVTEFGAARLWGRSLGERARALAGVAHPDFRDQLLESAARFD
jgi:4-hydroxybutyrate CoA-transferase